MSLGARQTGCAVGLLALLGCGGASGEPAPDAAALSDAAEVSGGDDAGDGRGDGGDGGSEPAADGGEPPADAGGQQGDARADDPGALSWSTGEPMPTVRTELAVAELGGKIYVAGG